MGSCQGCPGPEGRSPHRLCPARSLDPLFCLRSGDEGRVRGAWLGFSVQGAEDPAERSRRGEAAPPTGHPPQQLPARPPGLGVRRARAPDWRRGAEGCGGRPQSRPPRVPKGGVRGQPAPSDLALPSLGAAGPPSARPSPLASSAPGSLPLPGTAVAPARSPPAARPQPVPSPSPSDGPAGLRRLLPSRARTGSPRPDEGPGAGLPRCPCPSALRRVTLAPGPRQEGRARAPAGRASGTPRPLDLRAPPGSRRGAPEAGRDLSVDFRVGPSPGNGPAGLNRRGNQPARSPS